jgi:hypothetical protein
MRLDDADGEDPESGFWGSDLAPLPPATCTLRNLLLPMPECGFAEPAPAAEFAGAESALLPLGRGVTMIQDGYRSDANP